MMAYLLVEYGFVDSKYLTDFISIINFDFRFPLINLYGLISNSLRLQITFYLNLYSLTDFLFVSSNLPSIKFSFFF
jgi:hypothetical protein